jgi:hypothetical protein
MASSLPRLYRKLRFGAPIVVVSGLPRSGTSMLMKMLEAGGVPIVSDGQRTADEDNPRGYYEDERVKRLARTPDKSWLATARGQAVKIISFLLKELPATNNYKVLLLRRDLREVLASQAKMLERRGQRSNVDDDRMLSLFEKDLQQALSLLRSGPQFELLDLHYREVVERPEEAAVRIDAFLGGGLDTRAMASVVDQGLYRNRA